MYRPLTEDEKKQYLVEGAVAAVEEAHRHQPEIDELRRTAQTIFAAYLPKFSPQLEVQQAPMPSQKTAPPFEELWSTRVTPKVTGP